MGPQQASSPRITKAGRDAILWKISVFLDDVCAVIHREVPAYRRREPLLIHPAPTSEHCISPEPEITSTSSVRASSDATSFFNFPTTSIGETRSGSFSLSIPAASINPLSYFTELGFLLSVTHKRDMLSHDALNSPVSLNAR